MKRLILICAIWVLASPAFADDIGRANELLVEAVKLIQSAENEASTEKRLSLLEEAPGNRSEIVERYPSTDLAVKLITGQEIGNISLAGVGEAVVNARWPVCQSSPTYACIFAQALATAETIEYADDSFRTLPAIASAQAEVGNVKEPRRPSPKPAHSQRRLMPPHIEHGSSIISR